MTSRTGEGRRARRVLSVALALLFAAPAATGLERFPFAWVGSALADQLGQTMVRNSGPYEGLASQAETELIAQTPARPLRVLVQAVPTAPYVGQSVDLAVGVIAGRERPGLAPPRIVGADLSYLRTELIPMSLSAIGNMTARDNLYRSRFRLVPTRPGPLTVPPFVAVLGDRRGAGPPVRLNVKPLPLAGRPATFLGGVGDFQVEATARPAASRAGEPFVYRVTLTGPGALGVNAAPDVSALAGLPIGPTVERLPDESSAEPPSHSFVFRVRPTRPGVATLPPVRVSAFDPGPGVYVTKAAAGVPVRVIEPPRFDPSAIEYGSAGAPAVRVTSRTWWPVAALGASAASGTAVALGVWFCRRGGRSRSARRGALRAAVRLGRPAPAAEVGRLFQEGLVAYLQAANGRPAGALTPVEAGEGVRAATGNKGLSRAAAELTAAADRARFGAAEGGAEALAAGCAGLLRALAAAELRE